MNRISVKPAWVAFFLLALLALSIPGCEQGNSVFIKEAQPQNPVPRTSNITILFSTDIVGNERVGESFDSADVTIDPPFPGWYRWIDTRSLQFMPTEPLPPSSRFTFTVNSGVIEVPGITMTGKKSFDIYTTPFSVLAVHHIMTPSSTNPKNAILTVQLTFTDPVEPDEVLNNVRIYSENSNREIGFTLLNPSGAASEFTLVTEDLVRPEKENSFVRVEVDAAIKCLNGTLPLGETEARKVSLEKLDELKVNSISPSQHDKAFSISIRLSIPIDPVDASKYIELQPEMDYEVVSGYSDQLLITGDFKQEQQVRVILKPGLTALNGKLLEKEFSQTITFPKLQPSVSFASPGRYLSHSGMQNVALEVVNMDSIRVQVAKIYTNNLVHFLHNGGLGGLYGNTGNYGTTVVNELIPISSPDGYPLEVPTPVTVNFENLLRDNPSGLFVMTLRDNNRYWRSDSRCIMITDIGMIAKRAEDELHVWALSTSTLRPLNGVRIELLSDNNQSMGKAVTDGEGHAIIRGLNGLEEDFNPFVIAAQHGQDFSFLDFGSSYISTSNFDVGGDSYHSKPFDAWLYGDRDVYRPGETAHIACIVRSTSGLVPSNFPVRMKITDPAGRTVFEEKGRLGLESMDEFTFDIPAFARTGHYYAQLYATGDNTIGDYSFQVEEFMPDRIKVGLETNGDQFAPGDTIRVDVTGTMLFGPPASGRRSEAVLTMTPTSFQSGNWSDFTFGNSEREFSRLEENLGEQKLDDNGIAEFAYVIGEGNRPPAALKGNIRATVYEMGGRAVNNYQNVTIYPYSRYIGVKRQNSAYAVPNKAENIQFVVIDPEGNPVNTDKLEITFFKYNWRTSLVRDRNGHYYRSNRVPQIIGRETASFSGTQASVEFTPPTYGSYGVQIEDPESGASSLIMFYASGWGYSPWAMQNPDQIELELDREAYKPGQSANVLVKAPFGGKLLLTVERDNILYSRLIAMEGNTAEISIPVRNSFEPNAYVCATLVRAGQDVDPEAPMRAIGIVPLMIDMSSHRMGLTISAPKEMRPKQPMEVTLTARGASGTAAVTLAAVDEGILQLTNYQTPDPYSYYFGKRQLNVSTYDLFQKLMPETEAAKLHSSPGGGKSAADMGHVSALSQHRVKPVSLWSGIVTMNSGRAKIKFDIPEFNGRLRLMAVAVDGNNYDAAESYVQVRDPVVLTPTFPRFVAGGDKFRVPVNVFNGTGKTASIVVKLDIEGPLTIDGANSQTVEVQPEKEGQVFFSLEAKHAHELATATLTATGGGVSVSVKTTLPVRPPTQPQSFSGASSFEAGNKVTINLPGDFVEGTDSYALHVMSTPGLEYSASLEYLLKYPYGCLEQTASCAFPLLYYDDLAKQVYPDQFHDSAPEYYVQEAITKIISLQNSNGSFSYWPGDDMETRYPWASIYAAHFLVEAKEMGYDVTDSVLKQARRFLKNVVDGKYDFETSWFSHWGNTLSSSYQERYNMRIRTYAMFVLAMMDKPERGAMNVIFDRKKDKLTPESRALLAGAYAMSGDMATARELLPQKAYPESDQNRQNGYSFYSQTRSDAINLHVLAHFQPDSPVIPVLVERLKKQSHSGRWYTTQENAWALLALGRLYHGIGDSDYTGRVLVDGKETATFDSEPFSISAKDWANKKIELSTEGKGRCFYYWEARGLPEKPQYLDVNEGMKVTRNYYSYDGQSLALDEIKQGDLVVVEIIVSNTSSRYCLFNVIVDDMLPAGLEVENPRLESRQQLTWINRSGILNPTSMDMRDDRVLLFLDLNSRNDRRYYYSARAVTTGRFALPPIQAETMYDPTIRSISSSGVMEVKPRK